MSDQTEDARCTDWNHVWMQGCKTCVEQETEARVRDRYRESKVYGPGVRFEDGLDAARDAVAALLGKTVPPSDGVTEALAAIDALKGEQE